MTTFYAVTPRGRQRIKGARSVEGAVQRAREAGLEPKRIDVVETTTAEVPPAEQAPTVMTLEDALKAAGWIKVQ